MFGNFHVPNGPELLKAADGNLGHLILAIEYIRRQQLWPGKIKPEKVKDAIERLRLEREAA